MFDGGKRHISYRYAAIRNGVEFAELHALDTPTISMVSSGEVKGSLRGTFLVPSGVNFFTDLLRPYMVTEDAEYQLGEFVVTTTAEQYARGVVHTQLEGYDKGVRVQTAPLDAILYIPAGARYLDVIRQQLLASGIDRVIFDPAEAVLQTDREDWETGTSRIKVVNELLAEINYRPLWFDSRGNARLTKYTSPAVANATHAYRADETSVIKDEAGQTLDLYNVYNDFIVVVNSPEYEAPLVARVKNEDPMNPYSVPNIGLRTAPIHRPNNIAGPEELQVYAENLRFRAMAETKNVSWSTANNPHEVYEIVVLDHPQLQGVVEETEWAMTLATGADMTHKGRQVVYR